MTALVGVVLCLVIMNTTTAINCQVGNRVLRVLLTWALTGYNFKLWVSLSAVSTLYALKSSRHISEERMLTAFLSFS